MKITKQRLKQIIKEELSNVWAEMKENDKHAIRLRLQVEYSVDAPSMELIEAVYRIWPGFATEAVEVKPEIDQAIKMAIEDDAAAESAPAMGLEETWLYGDRANQQATQLLGGYARNVDLHKKVAAALRARTITAADVTGAVSKASSSSHVKQLLGLKS